MPASYAHTPPLLPMRIGVPAAHWRARRLMRDERARGHARETMRMIVGDAVTPDELDALTLRHLVEMELRNEFFWRARAFAHARMEEDRHLRAALDSGRGVIVSFCHFGPAFALPILLRRYGHPVHVVSGGGHFKTAKTGVAARRQRQQHRLRSAGRVVEAKGSYAALEALLRDGGLAGLAFDVGGRTPTAFIGRTLRFTSGTSRLAMATGALVVPLLRTHDGPRLVARFAAPFDPRDHEDAMTLHEALARHHDAWVATNPAALHLGVDLRRQLGLKRPKRPALASASASA